MKKTALFFILTTILLGLTATAHELHNRAVINASVSLEGVNTPASATHFTAAITGDQEVPAVSGSGKGTGAFVLDGEGLHYWITVSGLSAPMSAAHFHNAAAGENGGVIRTIAFDGASAAGVWKATDAQPLTPAMINEIVSGNIYVNIHTATNPPGEIRGQVTLSSGIGFVAGIDGSQEVPAASGNGNGTGAFVLDGEGLHYWITVDGLSGPMSAAHFHNAAAGQNGGVIRTIAFDGTSAAGVWKTTDDQALTPDLVGEIIAGNIYVNVHTAANPPGEIRGQVHVVAGIRMVADITGDQENPPVSGDARGTGAFVWNPDGLHYWVTVSGLSGPMSAAHFHNAAAGQNGGVIRAIAFDGTSAAGVWKASDDQALTNEMVWELLSGNIYVNIHTADNPPGEIRGQVNASAGVGFIASLNGDQENPPISGDARGTGAVTWDGEGLHYWVTVDGLTGDGSIRAAHFHNAAAGQNGGVVRPISFDGNTATGVWKASDDRALTDDLIGELWAGNIYFNIHTEENRGGEIRGQVVLPNPGAEGLEIAFSRSVAGRELNFAWSGITGPGGRVTVEIQAQDEMFARTRAGAGGYYTARLTDQTGGVLQTWNSIPIHGARMTNLKLPVGGRASIQGPFFGTPLESAGKIVPASPTHTVLSGIGPRVPIVSFHTAESANDGTLDLPVALTNAGDLAGGALTLTFDPSALSFRQAGIEGRNADVLETESGRVSFIFNGLASAEETQLQISFNRIKEGMPTLRMDGFFFDSDFLPILEVHESTLLGRVLPQDFALDQNVPNPFNPATQIRYALPQAGPVRLTVYNALGQEVARLVDGNQEAGFHVIRWNGEGMASGTYYYRLEASGFGSVRKMLLLK